MTRCQEAAFACVLLTVPRPRRGSFLCSAHVCEVRAMIWPCVYRDMRVGVCSCGPMALGAWKPTARARPTFRWRFSPCRWLRLFTHPWGPIGAAVGAALRKLLLCFEAAGEGLLLEKYLCFYSRSGFWIWHIPFFIQFCCRSCWVFFLNKRNQFKHVRKRN